MILNSKQNQLPHWKCGHLL